MNGLAALAFCLMMSPTMVYAAQQYCVASDASNVPYLSIQHVGNKSALRTISQWIEDNHIQTSRDTSQLDHYFFHQTFSPGACFYARPQEVLELKLDDQDKPTKWVPIVELQDQGQSVSYGLIQSSVLKTINSSPLQQKVSQSEIWNRDIDPKLTVIYVSCPADRNELCELTIKHKNKWLMDGDKPFSMKVLARSRREKTPTDETYRAIKDSDTPQGIYYLWGTFFTHARKFGAVPRIDIDGMQPPLNFKHQTSPKLLDLVPKDALNDYWLHEFPIAYVMGRYLFRIHDNSVDPAFPDTYTTPDSQKTFRASAGCLNTGDQMHRLLKVLVKLRLITPEQASGQKEYGRAEIPKIGHLMMIVMDR